MNPKTKAGPSGSPKKRKQRTPAMKFFITVAKIMLVFFIALSFALVGIVGGAVAGYIRSTPAVDESMFSIKNQNSIVYDMKENEISTLTNKENTNREIVTYGNIPEYLKNAFVAIEDERFYKHHGVDLKRTMGAAISYITNGGRAKYGGSTITQQVVKNITGDDRNSLQRKIQEQWRALQLEKKLEKWQILELYMNLAYMGRNYYGVQSASNAYFGKDVSQLSLAECAALAGITNLPGRYAPVSEKGKENCIERQRLVLQKMLENGFISKTEYDQAIQETLDFKERNKEEEKVTSKQTYFVDQVIRDVAKDLMDKYGYSKEVAYTWIYNYGLKIYTTQDSSVQKAMDEVFLNEEDYFPGKKNKKGELPQAAMAIIDPETGELRAVYGGRGEKTADSVLNRATQSKRQAGSSFKPIADYGPAINERLITAATAVDDVPMYLDVNNKGKMYPQNFPESYNGRTYRVYRGLTTIRTAISRSINVVAAKTWLKLGADKSFEYMEKSGIDTKNEDKYLSIALGGLKTGVNPLSMAAAYVPFAHKGMYYQPITYTRVEDSQGNVILDKKKDTKIKQKSNIVYEQSTAFIMTDMMKDTCRAGGTAAYTAIKNSKGQSIPIAGKTGTTNDDKDRWFLGYSAYYVGAVWYGYDTPTTVVLSGSTRNPSAVIWHAVMQKIHENIESPKDFPVPAGVVKKAVCIYSGKAPTDLCAHDPRGNAVREEYFIKGTEPSSEDPCDVHVTAKVDSDPKSVDAFGRPLLANEYCPSPVEKVFIKRPEPYMPVNAGDPYPEDWKYEVPIEYCPFHGPSTGGTTPSQTTEPAKQTTDNAPVENNTGAIEQNNDLLNGIPSVPGQSEEAPPEDPLND